MMDRRQFLTAAAGLTSAALAPRLLIDVARADTLKTLNIGYQKNGVFLVAKGQGALEKRFSADGITVNWVEFPSGPPMLEALGAGAVDYGAVGNAPPIFAQAGKVNLVYAAANPKRGLDQGVIVLPDSPIKTVADLKGKQVGFTKGSSANALIVTVLRGAGLTFKDINPVYLSPPDAAAAFARGAIDAWAIWDPFYAIAEISKNARTLPADPSILKQDSFFIANRDFASKHADVLTALNAELAKVTQWAGDHRDDVATLFAQVSGVSLEAVKRNVGRTDFTFQAVDEDVIKRQQAVADSFHDVGLIPSAINVRDVVWKPAA